MEFEVRPATAGDAPAIRRVARESWHAAHDGILGAPAVDDLVDEWYAVERLEESVDRTDARFLVAERDGEVVGFAQAVLGDEAAELARIYVAPDAWGEGVGSALLARVEAWCRDRGAERLRLVVLADNEVGNAFYEARGYGVIEERDAELSGESVRESVREKRL